MRTVVRDSCGVIRDGDVRRLMAYPAFNHESRITNHVSRLTSHETRTN